jgi:hypothetical protein
LFLLQQVTKLPFCLQAIHFRCPPRPKLKYAYCPPESYYLMLAREHIKVHPAAIIYVVSRQSETTHSTIKSMKAHLGSKLVVLSRSPAEDAALIFSATYLALSYGTFSWMAGFLGNAKQVHCPYPGYSMDTIEWVPWARLFVHDDPRYVYHEVDSEVDPLSACEVLQRNTSFSANVLYNLRGGCGKEEPSKWCPGKLHAFPLLNGPFDRGGLSRRSR